MYVAELMGLRPQAKTRIDPDKRYRVKSTGEVITGVELLRRRHANKRTQ